MKKALISTALLSLGLLSGCKTVEQNSLQGDGFFLGAATQANINVQSIRDPKQPNNRGIVGEASGERAVVAIDKLNKAKVNGETDAQSVNTSGG